MKRKNWTQEEIKHHLNYFNQISKSEKEYHSEHKWVYPDE